MPFVEPDANEIPAPWTQVFDLHLAQKMASAFDPGTLRFLQTHLLQMNYLKFSFNYLQ